MVMGRVVPFLLFAFTALHVPASAQDFACPDPAGLVDGLEGPLAHVRYMADDALEGREVGSRGERCVGQYIASWFEGLGLEPAGDGGSWFQSWEVRLGSRLAGENAFDIHGDSGWEGTVGSTWTPTGYSASGVFEGSLAAMPTGHGEGGHSLAGRFLVLDEGEDLHRVASEAARMGVAGVISLLSSGSELPTLERERRAALSIPVVAVDGGSADEVRAAAEQGASVRLSISVEPLRAEARNVVALLPGSDRSQTVIVGAHYDHLGFGGEGSLSPNEFGTVHNGADDNASGTAALLEVARRMAVGPRPDKSVLFLAFSGEERGLWGSAYYVDAPSVPLESTAAMLNMDMVGRVTDGKLTVFGTGTAEEWPELLARTNRGDLELQFVSDGYGASDHSSFYAKGIPVLHFFSGTHAEYHRIADDWELINEEGLVHVSELVQAVAEELAGTPGRVALTPVEGAGNPHGVPGGEPEEGQTARSGFSVRLGTIPDYSQEEGGMRITGVRDDSPAAKAGLTGGDVIVKMGDRDIEDVYSYMYALQAHEPGDVVDIVVIRDGERMTVTVTLEGTGE